MRTLNLHGKSNFYTYKGRLAYESWYTKLLFVFTDISAKRYLGEKEPWNGEKHRTSREYNVRNRMKIIFITNKQLVDRNNPHYEKEATQDAREIVMDSKRGTRYESFSSIGSYFFCLRKEGQPIPRVYK